MLFPDQGNVEAGRLPVQRIPRNVRQRIVRSINQIGRHGVMDPLSIKQMAMALATASGITGAATTLVVQYANNVAQKYIKKNPGTNTGLTESTGVKTTSTTDNFIDEFATPNEKKRPKEVSISPEGGFVNKRAKKLEYPKGKSFINLQCRGEI